MMRTGFAILAGLALATLLSAPVKAQQVMAAINGTVTDTSGAAVPGAQVSVTNVAQGTVFHASTNGAGVYNFPRIPVGDYEVDVQSHGFQSARQGPVLLVMNQTAQINVKLTVGAQSQTVQVTAAAPILQTETTENGTNVSARTNESLPLPSRNYSQLTLLAPGAVDPNPAGMQNGGTPNINGNREQDNNYVLDGMDNNQLSENGLGYVPSPDAIQEFNLITSNASAEFGNFQGGIVSVSIKSGTNHWHGDAWEFLRNDKLNANNWSNNWNHNPRALNRWNNFGATIGGPILRNKLFIFGDYQGQRNDTPSSTNSITVFTKAERQGDFSVLLDPSAPGNNGIATQLYNPFDVQGGQRQKFTGNMIPVNLMDPVVQKLFADTALYPLPLNDSPIQNQLNTTRQTDNTNQGDVKVDWMINSTNHMFVRYSGSRENAVSTDSFPLILPGTSHSSTDNDVLDWTHNFGATLVNEVRVGTNYVYSTSATSDNGLGNLADKLGITDGNARGPGLLALNIDGNVAALGNDGGGQIFADTVIEYEDQAIWTAGRHLLHFGFEGFRDRTNSYYGGNNGRWGNLGFSGQFTAGPDPLATATSSGATGLGTGYGEADFFLGLPNTLGVGPNNGVWGQRNNIFAGYLQDDWRMTDHLTWNLGLRYENHTPLVEVYDRQDNYYPGSGSIEYAGKSTKYGNNRALYNPYNLGTDFQPRLGFAWSPAALHNATVIRGSYTLSSFMEGTGTNLRLTMNPPYSTEYLTTYTQVPLPGSRLEDGITAASAPNDPWAGALIRIWSPDLRPTAIEQWNLTIEHQISNTSTLQVGYVGEHGTHIVSPLWAFQEQLHADGTVTPSPILAGNPNLAGDIGSIKETASRGRQEYNALQAVFQRRFASGLQYHASYTYSKCMSDSGGFYSGGTEGQANSSGDHYAQNFYDLDAEWGPCFFDVTHTLSSYALYALPIGAGKAMNLGPVGNLLLGNWNLSGIWQWHGGFATSPTGPDSSGTKNPQCCRMDCNGPVTYLDTPSSSGGIQWFSPASFADSKPHAFGTCGVGVLRGPGLDTLDVSVQREFPLSESKRFEFRGEFTNLTNTPVLQAPGMRAGSNLGRISSSQDPRVIQFALKFFY